MEQINKTSWCGYCENKYEEHEIGHSVALKRACDNCYRSEKVTKLKIKLECCFGFLLGVTAMTLLVLYFLTK